MDTTLGQQSIISTLRTCLIINF